MRHQFDNTLAFINNLYFFFMIFFIKRPHNNNHALQISENFIPGQNCGFGFTHFRSNHDNFTFDITKNNQSVELNVDRFDK